MKANGSERDALMFCDQEDFKRLLSEVAKKPDNRNWVDLMLKAINNAFQTDETMTNYKMRLKDSLLQQHQEFINTVSYKACGGCLMVFHNALFRNYLQGVLYATYTVNDSVLDSDHRY